MGIYIYLSDSLVMKINAEFNAINKFDYYQTKSGTSCIVLFTIDLKGEVIF